MLPTNVMSFMKKMIPTDEAQQQSAQSDSGTFGKLKQTISSSLLTAQDRVNKMSPRPSLIPMSEEGSSGYTGDSLYKSSMQQEQSQAQPQQQSNGNKDTSNNKANKSEPGKRNRATACRVCLKAFKPDDFQKICFECQQKVCEDCASYSKLEENEDANMWRCSVCRRKMASRVCIPQDSTDSMLDVPIIEALQRRHSDAKLGSSTTLAAGAGGALAPPRSPELRRHSDVSPASLKELEKQLKGGKTGDGEWRGGRSAVGSRSNSPPRKGDFDSLLGQPSRMASRRGSRISRQHSYDDEKNPAPAAVGNELGLGITNIPRRKSAYDVFAPALMQQIAQPNQALPGSRRPSFRAPPPEEYHPDESPTSEQSSPVLAVDPQPMRRRGSQLPDIAALRERGILPPAQLPIIPPPLASITGPNLEDLEAPKRQTSMDGEAIKIVIHDVDSGPICASKRRITLRKDPTDKAHRTRGFGMRVVGGKTGADGRLFAYIVWTVPGGPAEKYGLQQGDKILEWNSMSLIDRSFEEVCSIMDHTGDSVELLVEHATDFRMCDLLDENLPPGAGGFGGTPSGSPRKSGDGPVGLGLISDPENIVDKSPSSPTRRKLPKTPEQIAREKQVSGRVQLQVWYHGEKNELVVSLMGADNLAIRDDTWGHGTLPEAYAKICIVPKAGDANVLQTEVSPPTLNPIWNATLTFHKIKPMDLIKRSIEIQLWDLVPHTESVFLGECSVDVEHAFLDDSSIRVRLEDPKGLRVQTLLSANKTPSVSPRGSIAGGDVRMYRRGEYVPNRSMSDDMDSIGDGQSLLHPDHAWIGGSRRGSSQSEQLEVETYQLNKDFSRSLPGSRRSSFQDRDQEEAAPSPQYLYTRRRSSVARRDPDEILKSLKQVRGELGRTMSLSQERRHGSRRSSRGRDSSVTDIPELIPVGVGVTGSSPPSDEENKKFGPPPTSPWRGSFSGLSGTSSLQRNFHSQYHSPKKVQHTSYTNLTANMSPSRKSISSSTNTLAPRMSVADISNVLGTSKFSARMSVADIPNVALGPGQVQPKGYKLTTARYGEIRLSLMKIKGNVEVEVICAKNIVPVDCETPPDTYVKCYLRDAERLRHKKKTRVVRHSAEPQYKQVIKYQSSDVLGRNIVIMVWQRCVGFENNQALGGTEVNTDKMSIGQKVNGWYPLFPLHSYTEKSDSDNSP